MYTLRAASCKPQLQQRAAACAPLSAAAAVRQLPATATLRAKAFNAAPQRHTTATAFTSRKYVEWSTSSNQLGNWSQHEQLKNWVLDRIKLLQPSRVHLCDGSEQENADLIRQMVHAGTLIPLNKDIRPNSYLARSTASDVARVEEKTFICSENQSNAGPTNNWRDPEEMQLHMTKLFTGAMRGRTMYVIPYCMGPLNSPFSQIGVEITDSPYVVASMRVMTRMGTPALEMLGSDRPFVPCVHTLGVPLERGQEDTPWPQNSKEKWIVHFPEERRIWSYGSGYGGNALLGKKCFALRIASVMAQEEGWLAEHMLIVGVTNPQGVKKYIAAAFPSACGKTNLAMMKAKLPGWKVECVGDDIAWLRVGKDGRLWATNPEAGFFGVAPGTSYKSNPYAMDSLKSNVVFTNVAMKQDGDVWWEGMTDETPAALTSWLRTERYPDSGFDAAHPNSRFTVPASQCPVMDPAWEDPAGVPLDAIIFGGRRSTTAPLVYQARNWDEGVFVGASMTSETTAAAAGKRGVLRSDPFAMRPFCGYNMADYFAHWLTFKQRTEQSKLPKIFHVNWFRKSATGKFMWPGFGDNIRVLDWILQRTDVEPTDTSNAKDTIIGMVPKDGAVNTKDTDVTSEQMQQLLHVDAGEWAQEAKRTREFFSTFGDKIPQELHRRLDQLQSVAEQKSAVQPHNQ